MSIAKAIGNSPESGSGTVDVTCSGSGCTVTRSRPHCGLLSSGKATQKEVGFRPSSNSHPSEVSVRPFCARALGPLVSLGSGVVWSPGVILLWWLVPGHHCRTWTNWLGSWLWFNLLIHALSLWSFLLGWRPGGGRGQTP